MRATAGDIRLARGIVLFAEYALLPASIFVLALKLVGVISWSWWLVLTPGVLYAAHPIVIGGAGPLLQYRRYRKAAREQG